MDWLNLGVQLGILVISLAIAWGKLDKKIALTAQRLSGVDSRLEKLETNHLPHIQADITDIKLTLARIEEHLKK